MGKIFKVFGGALERMNAYIQENGGRYSAVRENVLEHACMLPQPFTAEQLEKEIQKLKEENLRLRIVNEYVKKLQALDQEKDQKR